MKVNKVDLNYIMLACYLTFDILGKNEKKKMIKRWNILSRDKKAILYYYSTAQNTHISTLDKWYSSFSYPYFGVKSF